MQKNTRRRIFKWLKIGALIYLIIGLGLYFFQEKFLFHPEPLDRDHVYEFKLPHREINLAVTNEKNLGIVQFSVPDSICKGVVLYFHGNRRNVERYARFAPNFTKNGYEVWMIDYPGFGKSTGDRSERIMYEDARELYKMALARFHADNIIIYGKSMGTGPAAFLASSSDCKQLILETPYYSIDALFRHYAFMYPVSMMCKYHFPINEYLVNVTAPVSILHGTDDEVIPFKHAKWLMEKTAGKGNLFPITGGKHNNLNDFPEFHRALDKLLGAE